MKSVALEGYWQVGKTTALRWLENERGYTTIGEPDHALIPEKPQTDMLDDWYWVAHYHNLLTFLQNPYHVVMERTAASTLAFMESMHPQDRGVLKKIDAFLDSEEATKWKELVLVVLLSVEISDYLARITQIESESLRTFLLGNTEFLHRYIDNLVKYIELLTGGESLKQIAVFENGIFRSCTTIQKEIISTLKGI